MNNDWGFLGRERVFNGPWSAFERAVARLLIHKGWDHTALIGGSGDNGGDIIASHGTKEVVYQLKFRINGGGVGKEIVDDIKRAMEYYGINYGCIVTNGYLTKGAKDYLENLMKSAYRISVLEGRDLLKAFRELDENPSRSLDMREYQYLAVDNILKAFERGSRNVMIVLATGLGKTFIAGKVLSQILHKYKTFKVLVLANKDDLIKQFDLALWPHMPKYVATHIWDSSEKPAFEEGITLATFQSMHSHIRAGKAVPNYNLVIIDECHHAGADTYHEVINEINPDFLLGMTATPFRTDDRDITEIFGQPVFKMDIIEGMRHGFLTRVDYRIFSDNIDWEYVAKHSKKSLTVKDLNKHLFMPQRDEVIVSTVKQVWENESIKRAIFFCASINHCKQMERELLSYGFRVRGLYSGMNPWEREKYLREFRQGKVDVLTAVDILNEGIDVPEVDLVIFLRVTHSRIIFLQQLGRGLRLSPGKKKVTVLDFVADIKRVASIMNLSNQGKMQRSDEIEVLKLNDFDIKFIDNTSETFFEALINEKFEIEDFEETKELFLP